MGVTIADVLDFSYSSGKQHSFFDSQCLCDILHTPFVEQANCIANSKFQDTDSIIGLSVGVYLGLGAEVSIGIDVKAWTEELIDIFNDSIKPISYY